MRNRTANSRLNGTGSACGGAFPFYFSRSSLDFNAKKNPLMNRLRFSFDIPLWLLRFFFRSVNVPSILLFVFGIPLHSGCWYVNRYGR